MPGIAAYEEAQLEEFLNMKSTLSKEERKYLTRYVIRGIPLRLHGRVYTSCLIF